MSSPRLIWETGTGYDFFISLDVLHKPAHCGVRPAWTAGMRARLAPEHRETLEIAQLVFDSPSHWVHTLSEPKDAATVLWHLSLIPPAERILTLACSHSDPPAEVRRMLEQVVRTAKWSRQDVRILTGMPRQFCNCYNNFSAREAETVLSWFARAEIYGDMLLEALHAYHEVFFAEEERRIRPALEQMLDQAKESARTMPVTELIETLTQGINIPHLSGRAMDLVLTPSFWSAPLIQYQSIDATRDILVFGGRPKQMSLIPGEIVPDMLIRSLKTLSDPTRLRILQHLTIRPMTPTQLARHLRLRPPTITHHLKVLRLAGLIRITQDRNFKPNYYAARPDAVAALYERLDAFLNGEDLSQENERFHQHH